MDTLLSGIGWMFAFIGLGLMFEMPKVLDTIRAICGKRRP